MIALPLQKTLLQSNIQLYALISFLENVFIGKTDQYYTAESLLNEEFAAVTSHEIIFSSDAEILAFDTKLCGMFNKYLESYNLTCRVGDSPYYSPFKSIFTTQNAKVRVLWLKGKVISVLLGNKPETLLKSTTEYWSYNFGMSETCSTHASLSDEDKKILMGLPQNYWFTQNEYISSSTFNKLYTDSDKSVCLSKGYFRHGSIEYDENLGLHLLINPDRLRGNIFDGVSSKLEHYLYLADIGLLSSGGSYLSCNRENFTFYNTTVLDSVKNQNTYVKLEIEDLKSFVKEAYSIRDKNKVCKSAYSSNSAILDNEFIAKYTNNPNYSIVYSKNNYFFYINKTDKLKITTLKTKVTKTLRENFIKVLNVLGYLEFLNSLDFANSVSLVNTNTLRLMSTYSISTNNTAKETYTQYYNNLYEPQLAETSHEIFGFLSVLQQPPILSFNKKFALTYNLSELLQSVFSHPDNSSWILVDNLDKLLLFITTNFIVPDEVSTFLNTFTLSTIIVRRGHADKDGIPAVRNYRLHSEPISTERTIKSCMTLSDQGQKILNSVGTLTSPSDIITWLELCKTYFVTTLPAELNVKFPNAVSIDSLSNNIKTYINNYINLLQIEEPMYNNLYAVSEDSSTESE